MVRPALAPVSKVIGTLIEPAVGEAREVLAHGEDPMVGDRLDQGHAREAVVCLQGRGAVGGHGADRGVVSRLARCGRARFDHLVDAVLVAGRARACRGGNPVERACAHRLIPPQLRRLDRELAALIAEVGPAVGAEHLERALGERLRQAPQLGVEVALRREARLAQRAAPQPDLAVAIGILPVDERDRDLGAVEQAGAHLVLDDAALGEHARPGRGCRPRTRHRSGSPCARSRHPPGRPRRRTRCRGRGR